MSVARRQRTLARPVSVTGFGYFSGRDIRVEFWPAAEHAGVTFVRHDIGGAARIPADAALRIDQPRRTTLELNGIRLTGGGGEVPLSAASARIRYNLVSLVTNLVIRLEP